MDADREQIRGRNKKWWNWREKSFKMDGKSMEVKARQNNKSEEPPARSLEERGGEREWGEGFVWT